MTEIATIYKNVLTKDAAVLSREISVQKCVCLIPSQLHVTRHSCHNVVRIPFHNLLATIPQFFYCSHAWLQEFSTGVMLYKIYTN